MPFCLTLLIQHHPPIWTQVPRRFPRTSICLMKNLINQEALIYSLELIYSTNCFNSNHRWKQTRTSWPQKEANRNSFYHMDLTSEDNLNSNKTTLFHLRKTPGSQFATYEELCTLVAEIEACLNSRPLCASSDDPFNRTYLSPGHFLIGDPLTQLPATDFTDVKCNRISRWQTYQQQL